MPDTTFEQGQLFAKKVTAASIKFGGIRHDMSPSAYVLWQAGVITQLKGKGAFISPLASLAQYQVDEGAYQAIADATDNGNGNGAKWKRTLALLDTALFPFLVEACKEADPSGGLEAHYVPG